MPMTAQPNQDEFLREVLSLFALEAEEWLGQIHTALAELHENPAPERRAKLFETITRGLTTLGGSAATAELLEIERLTFALLPVVGAMRACERGLTASASVLAEGLRAIASGVGRIAAGTPGPIESLDALLERIAKAGTTALEAEEAPETGGSGEAPSPPAAENRGIIAVLRDLQKARHRTAETTRNVTETIIQRLMERRGESADDAAVRECLDQIEALDQKLLDEAKRRVPMIQTGFQDLKAGRLGQNGLEHVLQEVLTLQELAQEIGAAGIMQFLLGLHAFLTIAAQRHLPVARERLDAVEGRIGLFVSMVHQWVRIGQDERAVIEQALPR